MIENFLPYSVGVTKAAVQAAGTPAEKDLVSRRIACRGLIMNCANAIRLQVNSQTGEGGDANSYLKNFFQAHPSWKAFQPKLTVWDILCNDCMKWLLISGILCISRL